MAQATNNRQHAPYALAAHNGVTTYVLPPLGGMAAGQWHTFCHTFGMLLDDDTSPATNWQVLACTPVGTHYGIPGSYVVTLQAVPVAGTCNVQVLVSPCPTAGMYATWC